MATGIRDGEERGEIKWGKGIKEKSTLKVSISEKFSPLVFGWISFWQIKKYLKKKNFLGTKGKSKTKFSKKTFISCKYRKNKSHWIFFRIFKIATKIIKGGRKKKKFKYGHVGEIQYYVSFPVI